MLTVWQSILAGAAITYYGYISNDHAINERGRIGIVYNPGSHTIYKVYKNSPAHIAGLQKGDIVIKIDDKQIRGPSNTVVNLTIQRGNKTLYFCIKRVPWEEVKD